MSKIIKKELYTIIIDECNTKQAPLFCNVCDLPMTKKDDSISYLKFECCYDCSSMWAYRDKEKWLNGERPSKNEIEKYKILRTRISSNFIL